MIYCVPTNHSDASRRLPGLPLSFRRRQDGHGSSLTTLREKLIKIGAKVVRHAKYVTFQMAEVAVPRELFAAMFDGIQQFRVPPPLVQRG